MSTLNRFMCLLISCLLLVPLHAGANSATPKETKLRFTATPTRQGFRIGEDVDFIFEIRNEDTVSLLVSRAFVLDYYVSLEIQDQGNERIRWCGRIITRHPGPREFAILEPGKALKQKVTISCDKRKIRGYALNRAGTYRVSAQYTLPQPREFLESIAKGAIVAKGPFRANAVQIEILPPG